MQAGSRAIPVALYYILLSTLTSFVFIVAGALGFALFSLQLTGYGLLIIAFLVLWKSGVVGSVTWFFHRTTQNKAFAVGFIGAYLGRFYGLLVGGFLGARIGRVFHQADAIGFVVGALALYFLGRRIGSKVSIAVGQQLDKVFSIAEAQEPLKLVRPGISQGFVFVFYVVVIPGLYIAIGFLMTYFGLPVGYLVDWLPFARIVLVTLAIVSIGYPWLIRNRWSSGSETASPSPKSNTALLGLSLSITPAVYGIVLFVAFGASLIELCLFAALSSIAAMIWSLSNPMGKPPARP